MKNFKKKFSTLSLLVVAGPVVLYGPPPKPEPQEVAMNVFKILFLVLIPVLLIIGTIIWIKKKRKK